MTRILDIDLDFFVEDPAYYLNRDDPRRSAEDHPPWPVDDAISFLRGRCGLTGRLPGLVVEHHADLFFAWRDAIEAGEFELPLSVTHVDAHADLGLGEGSYFYLLTELVHRPVAERRDPRVGECALGDGNWLTFALACRWLSDLTYVYNTPYERPDDLMICVMEGFDLRGDHLQLAALDEGQLREAVRAESLTIESDEPRVPFKCVRSTDFKADAPYDVVCLTRSPPFTPVEADGLFDAIRERFIDEIQIGWGSAVRPRDSGSG